MKSSETFLNNILARELGSQLAPPSTLTPLVKSISERPKIIKKKKITQ